MANIYIYKIICVYTYTYNYICVYMYTHIKYIYLAGAFECEL